MFNVRKDLIHEAKAKALAKLAFKDWTHTISLSLQAKHNISQTVSKMHTYFVFYNACLIIMHSVMLHDSKGCAKRI